MALAARILTYLFGAGLGTVTAPVLAMGLLVSLYHNFNNRREAADKRIETTATAQCNANWISTLSKKREREANARANQAQELIEGERKINEGLNNELDIIRSENEKLRGDLTAAGDKCLSDSVLTALGRRESVDGKSPSAGGSPAKGKPADR